eukprot:128169-Prymnesium_polylepis.1
MQCRVGIIRYHVAGGIVGTSFPGFCAALQRAILARRALAWGTGDRGTSRPRTTRFPGPAGPRLRAADKHTGGSGQHWSISPWEVRPAGEECVGRAHGGPGAPPDTTI